MKLKKLTLKNFKGIKSFTFGPDGESTDVWGANESGKTTVFDALTWLLTGKDSRDRSPDSFGIKTRGPDGEVRHGLEHQVEGVFEVDGAEITLRKTYKEKWVSKRGAANKEFSGHSTDHHIDGVPENAGDYQAAVEAIIPAELLKMLTMPDYFPEQMHWTDRRAILFELAGDIDPTDIIEGNDYLQRYPDVIGNRSHEQQEKVLKARKRELNKELDNIPDRIDEVSRMIEQVDGVEDARQTVADLKEKKDKIEAKRSEVKSGGALAELKVERQELQAKYREGENAHDEKLVEAVAEQREKVSALQDKLDEIQSEFREAKRKYSNAESDVARGKRAVEEKQKEIEEIGDRQPKEDTGPDVCPMCERPMEADSEHDYQSYLEEFNEQKATDLKAAKEELKEIEFDLESSEKLMEERGQKAANLKGKLSQRKQALGKAEQQLSQQKSDYPDFSDSEAAERIERQIEQVDQKIADHRGEKQSQLDKLSDAISDVESKISDAEKVIHQAAQNEKYRARIEELQGTRKEVAGQLEQTEADLHLLEEFVRARSAYVTDKVNAKFAHVSWKLFEEQINGGVNEVCEAVYKGVPFGEGLNNAGRIQAGLDIISTLSEHYGKSAPVFVDNAESVTDIPDYGLQVIALYVSADHPQLTVQPKQELAAA